MIIHPRPVGSLTWVHSWHDSPYGRIRSDWKLSRGRFTLDLVVPPGTSADVILPTSAPGSVQEGGRPAVNAVGVRAERADRRSARFEVESGRYHFSAAE